jgi:serine/threonine-protein kinase
MSNDHWQQDILGGETVGGYCIEGMLGKGGMGEVYRARDPKLQRDVAIKILPSAFAKDPGRLSRFHREARLLASLNHPNIASIYGFEDSGHIHALVMELVDGPTLADKIRQGPILLDDAISIATQICDALEYAHEEGVVHRDLKPANIKVATNGAVKILDFGIAKVLDAGTPTDIADSPTMTAMDTREGVLLGTPAYMSPEQARGKVADRRADIWAFGCVLFEMLSGKTVFHGETVTDTLASVIGAQPDWSLLPTTTPKPIRELLRRCLHRDLRRRLQAIGEARIALEDFAAGASPEPVAPGSKSWKVLLATGFVVALIALVAGVAAWNLKSAPSKPLPVTRFTIALPPGRQLAGASALAFSPDATQLAYVATERGVQQIYLLAMDRGEAKALTGTEGATLPFFSPDGKWLAFIADRKLKKISIQGGVPQDLTEIGAYSSGASWGSDHSIVFAPYSSVLLQVANEGGASHPITHFENGETLHVWPQFLPGGKAVLFNSYSSNPTGIAVQRIGGERRNLIQQKDAIMPNYVDGRLIYAQAGTLMAVPFDSDSLQIVKGAIPIPALAASGILQYSVSSTGSLVYVSGTTQQGFSSELVWIDRKDRKERRVGLPVRRYNQPRISPDGARIAVDIVETSEKMQVWLYDIARDTFTPFTFEGVNRHAIWAPDSKRLVFMSNKEGPTQIFWKSADGSGPVERLTSNRLTAAGDILHIPFSLSQNGLLTFIKLVGPTEAEPWVLPVGETGTNGNPQEQRLPVQHAVMDIGLQLSPDGQRIAYASEESGRRQIYVQAITGSGGKQQVSTDGGNEPQWNPNGRELFYRSGDKMMAVAIGPLGFAEGKEQALFQGPYMNAAGWVRANYDVSHDGQHFLMLKPVDETSAPLTEIHVVLNWSEELKRLVPTESR